MRGSAYHRWIRSWLVLAAAVFLLSLLTIGVGAEGTYKIEIVPQIPHSESFFSVAFSPDGRQVLSGSGDQTAKLWDTATGQLLRTFEGHYGAIAALAFSPDGTLVLSADEKTLKLWEAATGRLIRTVEAHTRWIRSAAFSPDGRQLVSGSWDNTVKLWDAATGQLIHTFEGHSGEVFSVAFSPDGRQVLSGSRDKTLKLWDATTGQLIHTLGQHSGEVYSVAFSPDGFRALSGSEDTTLKLWDVATGQLIRTFEGHSDDVWSVAFSPDGRRVLSGSWDKTVKFWDAATGKVVRNFEGHTDWVDAVALSRDGTRVLSASRDRTARLWDAATGQVVRTFGAGSSGIIASVAVSPDGRQVLSGSEDKTLKLWDAATGRLIRTFDGNSGPVNSGAFSPDGARILSGSGERYVSIGHGSKEVRYGTLQLWDATTGQLLRTFEGHSFYTNSVAFSPDGKQLLSGSSDMAKLWDTATGDVVHTFEVPSGRVNSVAFSPDGERILSGSGAAYIGGDAKFVEYGTVKLWDATTGQLLRSFDGHSGKVTSVAFSPDGRQVLSASYDNTLRLWDATTGQLVRTIEGRFHWVLSVAFSPEGRRLASGSGDRTVKLWDATTGELVRTLEGHSAEVVSVAFSPNGRQLVSGSRDTTTRIWRTDTGELLATLMASPDGEWLVLTPKGFLNASSPAAGKLLSLVRGLEPFSIAQFWDHLYRPDLVEEALKGDPDGKYKDAAFNLNLEKVLDSGPVPELELLEKKTEVAGGTVRLTVRIKGTGGGIGEKLIWRVNGITQGDPTPPSLAAGLSGDLLATATVIEMLTVDPAQRNIVEVTAYNGAGLLATRPLRITVDQFGATTTERPRMHVLAIGVDKYRMPDYQLKYAVKDAKEFAEAMKIVGSSLFASIEVTELHDDQVTRDGIAAAFDKIATVTNPFDVFVLFLGGHGKSVEGRYYYYPQNLDFAAGQTYQNGIGQDLWQEWLAKVAAQKKLLILDTCESGAAGGLIRGADSVRQTAMEQLQYATGDNLIAAAGSSKSAIEGYKRHGVLTYALLEALTKKEGEAGEEKVKVGSLADYVGERVPAITHSVWGVRQMPVRKLSGNDFPIGLRVAAMLSAGSDEEEIPNAPTHVLIRAELVRKKPAPDAESELEKMPAGTLVRVVKHAEGGGFALIAREGKKLGYVAVESLAPIQ